MYISTKTWGHDIGLSCCFRQWRATSHCRFLHGYAIAVRVEFASHDLDVRNWVVDFGALKGFKTWLQSTFDHKILVAHDDPEKDLLCSLAGMGIADCIVIDATGCEAFARMIYDQADVWLGENGHLPRVHVHKVEVREHGANSAIYMGAE